ncbi:extracellular superoxide dismutase [Cu-Zn] [Bombina bombina]|uniref:extracellular superoxide dismutase [Cu-Zn] n=1 Tax=Bombina bombina TaxID=8345 RepID=UPI00235A641A|nr:extracellular superoxide dismutase [Cu-Zn] [Bombina bombina]
MYYTIHLAVILFISTLCKAEEVKNSETEPWKDIQDKISDLWIHFLNGKPSLRDEEGNVYAGCDLKPNSNLGNEDLNITGQILFKQAYNKGKLEGIFLINGFPIETNQTFRAIHIHAFGDLSNSCDSVGAHYNPIDVNHPNHPGDVGNFCTRDGKIQRRITNLDATVFGPHSVIGRSVVVHQKEDDLGLGGNQASLENGNAGKRLACCVIGYSTKAIWEKSIKYFVSMRRSLRRANAKSAAQKSKIPTKV